jgi:predicted ester cyclase
MRGVHVSQEAKLAVRRAYEVYATGHIDVLDEVMHPGYVDHNPVDGQSAGRDGVKEKVLGTRSMLTDIVIGFEDQVAEGDRVASRLWMTAADPDGHEVRVQLIAITEVVDGLITAEWGIAETFITANG